MGVNGLWTVIQPCARPTNLATLNRKRLAVDASIWIYQFLKAVRDKEGNALRNSHVVGFFRRICKLLWFGIQPVFVFDGGAPALKRATIQKRQRRREGRREDAVRTAGKLLAVQMQRLAEEDAEKKRREREAPREREEEAALPDASEMVYVDEIGMSQRERQQNRKFHKKDAYHLPELDGGIAAMGKPDDPRIMSVEELEEYARQFHDGEDVNLYDFSKIDFDSDFFKSLPPPDRYNILNAARLRSRLRMGLSKDQLDDMFPDRMAFSRFQIERVKERNHLTQRLMYEVGMTGTDLTLGVNARVAGEKDREYILVKNEGVEGGWALGVVSKEKDIGEAHKPIDVDAIQVEYQTKDEDDEEDLEEFEDVPVAGLNRLPKIFKNEAGNARPNTIENRQPALDDPYTIQDAPENGEEDSLFVGGSHEDIPTNPDRQSVERVHSSEEDDVQQAIALSLRNQHDLGAESEEEDFEDVPPPEAPKWKQKALDSVKPISWGKGSMIAHVVNNRANAAVAKRKEVQGAVNSDSEEEDMQTIMARARKAKAAATPSRPVFENKKNPFDGPLPFPKLDWGLSLFAKSGTPKDQAAKRQIEKDINAATEAAGDTEGGFALQNQPEEEGPKPLPPWLVDETDIRDSMKKQQDVEREINAQDRDAAVEEARQRDRERMIEIDSSSDDGSEVEIIERPPTPKAANLLESSPARHLSPNGVGAEATTQEIVEDEAPKLVAASPDVEFEDVQLPQSMHVQEPASEEQLDSTPEVQPSTEIRSQAYHEVPDSSNQLVETTSTLEDEEFLANAEEDEYSDPEDEELLEQMALEAEEHARFASELNQKSEQHNKEDYERELRALRTQQKKDRRDADEVTQVMITECQALLRLFGIPYITAPMEAEAQCAELVRLGMVDGIVTDDSDIFLFGGTRVYKNMFNSNKFVECYLGTDLERELSLSREQLISLAHLLGSDYTEGIPGVGPVTAVEILSEFPGRHGLTDFREWWNEVQSHTRSKDADAFSTFRKKFRKSQAAKLFLPTGFPSPAVYDAYLHPDVDDSSEMFQWGVPDVEGLRQFLMATIGWTKERTDEVLVPVIRDMNKRGVEGTQSNITRYFSGGTGVGAKEISKESFAPRQRTQGSKRMAAAVDKLKTKVADGAVTGTGVGSETNKRRRTARRGVVDEDY